MKILNIIDDVETDHLINNNKKIEILNWNRNKSVNFESIITYIEKKDDFFKKKYVSFISKIKNHLFNKKSLYKNFNIENKFSLWEMSLFEEKNIYKNPEIIDLIKILALREIVKEKKIKKIIIFSNNKKLGTNISSLINNVKVELNSVNAEEDTKLAEQHNVRAYPTCILEKANGETVELDKACTYENLKEFVKQNA